MTRAEKREWTPNLPSNQGLPFYRAQICPGTMGCDFVGGNFLSCVKALPEMLLRRWSIQLSLGHGGGLPFYRTPNRLRTKGCHFIGVHFVSKMFPNSCSLQVPALSKLLASFNASQKVACPAGQAQSLILKYADWVAKSKNWCGILDAAVLADHFDKDCFGQPSFILGGYTPHFFGYCQESLASDTLYNINYIHIRAE